MTEQRTPEDQLRCEVCERPVVAELGLWTPSRIICVDCEENPPRREQTAQDLDYCPACGGECNDEQPCDYCNNTGYVTETAYNEYRPLSPEECL